MNWKNVLFAIAAIIILLLLSKLIPNSKYASGTVNYAPDGFNKTIAAGINGVVTTTEQRGLFYVTINKKELPFSYDPGKITNNLPKGFIIVGDSIYKNANSDTFYLIRGNKKWEYFLLK
jgi:hypothetical protein